MQVTTAVILAGGLGTRLRNVVPDVPKPMADIGGRPFLERQIDYWIAQGVERFVLSVGYRREVIMDHFGTSYRDCQIEYAVEESPLGTGGGLLLAVNHLNRKGPFLLLNGDTYFEVSLQQMLAFHARHDSEWTFSLFRAREPGRYMGMEVGPDGRILLLDSGTGKPGRLANGGVYIVEQGVFSRNGWEAGMSLSLENEILPGLFRASARLFGCECDGRFIDIGVPDDYFRATDMLVD